jgi:hypothetical protein
MDDAEAIAVVEAGLGASQLAFLAAWRDRTRAWPDDARADLRPPDEHDGSLVVFADLVDVDHHSSLLTLAAHFDGVTVRCDRAHDQLFVLPAEATADAMTATGGAAELADRTATWFEGILRRRVVRHEWKPRRGPVSRAWLFADSGEVLVVQGRPRRSGAPDVVCAVRTERY